MISGGFISTSELSLALLTCLLLSGHSESRPQRFVPSSGSTDDGKKYAEAAMTEWKNDKNKGLVLHTQPEYTGRVGTNVGVEELKQFKGNDGIRYSHDVLSAGLETGYAGLPMARATGYGGTLHTGPVDLRARVALDTGLLVGRNVELKVLGMGWKLGADGLEFCMFLCLGLNWA